MVKKLKKNNAKLLLSFCIIIFMGSFVIGVVDYKIYSKVINQDIENITKLTSSNISDQISTELIKPLFVSLTMANDEFLKDWIQVDNEINIEKITSYLNGIRKKYNYSSVFYVSNITNKYYNHKGIHKEISSDDKHDVWYYNFIKKDLQYALDVDNDQASKNDLTVFVNCKIIGDNGELLGVTGVGLKMKQLSSMFKYYRKSLNVEAFLVDSNGLIQVHTNLNKIEKENIFNHYNLQNLKTKIINKNSTLQAFKPTQTKLNSFVITRYIEELDWYLINIKDTSELVRALHTQVYIQIFLTVLVFIAVITINIKLVNKSQKELTHLATTDMLTSLYNRRSFDYKLHQAIKNARLNDIPCSLVLFDIDNFKEINDSYSHLVGDALLKSIANYAMDTFKGEAVIARWGGDEFAIIFERTLSDVLVKMNKFRNNCAEIESIANYNITISVGISEYLSGDTAITMLSRADKALLQSKKNGKDQIKYL